jgi:hypothetical protein
VLQVCVPTLPQLLAACIQDSLVRSKAGYDLIKKNIQKVGSVACGRSQLHAIPHCRVSATEAKPARAARRQHNATANHSCRKWQLPPELGPRDPVWSHSSNAIKPARVQLKREAARRRPLEHPDRK